MAGAGRLASSAACSTLPTKAVRFASDGRTRRTSRRTPHRLVRDLPVTATPARQLAAERPGDLMGAQPRGPQLGSPGPDQGYLSRWSARFDGKLQLAEGEHERDALVGAAQVALKRASIFGRAPVLHDLTVALTIWGFLDERARRARRAAQAALRGGGQPAPLRQAAAHRRPGPARGPAPEPHRDHLGAPERLAFAACRRRLVLADDRADVTTPGLGARSGESSRRSVVGMQQLRLESNGFTFDAIADGPDDGELVMLLHGFPETSRSWRHQIPALSRGRFPRSGARPAWLLAWSSPA